MPFPNEHAARQADPKQFSSFRRKPMKGEKGISIIFGLKDGKSEIQSLRFDRKQWTPRSAKKWLRDHSFKTAGFEPAGEESPVDKWQKTISIEKIDQEQQLVFGWLYVCKTQDGDKVVDHSGETIAIDELEKATYNFALKSRQAGQMHERIGIGRLVEVCVFTPEKREAMRIPEGIVPDGAWVGFKIDDPEAWEGVKSGRFKMFSLGGKAIRRELEDQG